MLRELAKETDDARVAMVLDQAGSHGAKTLLVQGNITLVPLPPYAPDLNPVERVRRHLEERFLSHRLRVDCDAIADAASRPWNRLEAETGRLTSLCSPPGSQGSDDWWVGITANRAKV